MLINTTSQPVVSTVTGQTIPQNTYEVALNNGSIDFLGLQASGTLIVGVSDGVFEIDIPSSNPLSLSFFGLGGVSISGYIDSNGQFSLTGSVGFQLGQSGNEIYGSLSRSRDQATRASREVCFSGGAEVFGINLASISGWLTIDNNEIDLGANVSILWWSFGFNIGIGQLSPPTDDAPNSAKLFYSVPATAQEGSKVSFGATATDGNGNTLSDGSYDWTIYYNGQVYATENTGSPTLQLEDPGTYTVVLNAGAVSKSSTINVVDVPPTITSLNLQTGYAYGQPVTLAPSVSLPLPSPAQDGLTYDWTVLKNGQPFSPSTSPTFNFTPAAPGNSSNGAPTPDIYQVTYTVSDAFGGSATATGTFRHVRSPEHRRQHDPGPDAGQHADLAPRGPRGGRDGLRRPLCQVRPLAGGPDHLADDGRRRDG